MTTSGRAESRSRDPGPARPSSRLHAPPPPFPAEAPAAGGVGTHSWLCSVLSGPQPAPHPAWLVLSPVGEATRRAAPGRRRGTGDRDPTPTPLGLQSALPEATWLRPGLQRPPSFRPFVCPAPLWTCLGTPGPPVSPYLAVLAEPGGRALRLRLRPGPAPLGSGPASASWSQARASLRLPPGGISPAKGPSGGIWRGTHDPGGRPAAPPASLLGPGSPNSVPPRPQDAKGSQTIPRPPLHQPRESEPHARLQTLPPGPLFTCTGNGSVSPSRGP